MMSDELCWLIESPADPPAFERLLWLLREDVPGAAVAAHERGRYTVFSVLGATPSLRRWADEGLPIWEIDSDPERLVDTYRGETDG